MKIPPADPEEGGIRGTNSLQHPWVLSGVKGDPNSEKLSLKITKLMKNTGFVMSILAHLPRVSVSPGAGHLPTSPQPPLALAELNFHL